MIVDEELIVAKELAVAQELAVDEELEVAVLDKEFVNVADAVLVGELEKDDVVERVAVAVEDPVPVLDLVDVPV